MNTHEIYIKRCIEIAKNGLGSTRPNPMVGAVIVHNNKIIGEGFTSTYGGNHAEVNAINSVANKALLKESTIYVTLEPCSHYGKTPPCSDLIIKNKIPNVVIGCIDDNEQVAGKGIAKLKASGCQVIVGILEDACKKHHKRFFTFHNKKRPYIILKWAETENGYLSPEQKDEQKPVWITSPYSRQLVHQWRTEEQAILIGTNTALDDNPSLTVRDWTGNNPTRIVIDRQEKLPKTLSVFNNQAETITITNKTVDFSKPLAKQICDLLFENQINSVIIEGGAKTLQTFIDENLWDEARVFKGAISFRNGTKAPKFTGSLTSAEKIMTDTLKIYTND
ncbi:bifunctional diaminohydroxyphosphoribosylaminopyrimidine deaminase/5-amino-6-(5-phosphoribosylamino)uracil reductase RibD [Tamlana sp. 2_MG-2023]|uniref:bifunctional diaminohydroxyphosphoribosylaminopyrimidine deaminase/5-amino-6-(5-phosphoribosylamino)uracil reductase RibD n=1 Tax=unclassified Tamlana TaxID=2614803 RepID=UPI0026E49468|nr:MULTISPECIES: bifunctional diaminohydroxyphosphoribosylaminopyrimidine deaminase/5-amino-6-(5-phosphoribosylamino)uracil reductase RibD [unclassified Tamlana]MDO6759092.1 bifunctional diaminohydroxyphosphoribosylaminopyrimidine deaminase/5-amino-6-(5-phosphoribosylamino)uracil reductase RibD [Tamlana sp. 2_MG-2023]MDO6789791.1 bifunctional diaminohydroxyphosphoribosylaminopyrimidine deaminase/5-amino-6-(5-phosphoribosylamino)uracil reductase RibD [Tamlana sp. 1_MG-2023]